MGMLTPAKPILELYEERTIKVGTHVICAESKDGILKDEVGIVSFCKSNKVQVRWTGENCDGILIKKCRRPPTGFATCKVSGYKTKEAQIAALFNNIDADGNGKIDH